MTTVKISDLGAKGQITGGIGPLSHVIQMVISLLFLLAIVMALFMLLYSGFMWITSAGDKQKLQQSRQRIIFVIVGLVVVFVSIFIIQILGSFFGIDNILTLPNL